MTFPAQRKKNLGPFVRRVRQWNTALDGIDPTCTCWAAERRDGRVEVFPDCPAAPGRCLGRTLVAVRVNMNLFRLAHIELTDQELTAAIRTLGDHVDTLPDATSQQDFANGIVEALRPPAKAGARS